MLRQKIQVAYLLISLALNLVYFTSQYDLSRLNHRFDSKQLVTSTGHTKKIEDQLHNLTSSGELNCSVCLSEHDHDTVKLPCSHHLHGACLRRIFEQCHTANITLPLHLPRRCPRCPICRADIHLHDDNCFLYAICTFQP